MKCIVIAGPNGAGKTTFATEFLPQEGETVNFFNADLIAAGLSPFAPEKVALAASKILLQYIDECLGKGESFGIETTLAGKSYLKRIPLWKQAGYHVELHYLQLPSVELAVERVKNRVMEGGHHIPELTIRRRYKRGLEHLSFYKQVVDSWRIWDTSDGKPELIDENDI